MTGTPWKAIVGAVMDQLMRADAGHHEECGSHPTNGITHSRTDP